MESKKVVKKKAVKKDPVQELTKKVEQLQKEIEELKKQKEEKDIFEPYRKTREKDPYINPMPWRQRPYIEYWLYQTKKKSPYTKLLDSVVFYV